MTFLKRGLLGFILLIPSVLFSQDAVPPTFDRPPEILPVNKFGGLDTDNDPLLIEEGDTPDAYDVLTDLSGLQNREGYVQFSTSPAKYLWILPSSNGTRYKIRWSSNTLTADSGSGLFNIYCGTVAFDQTTAGTTLADRFYYSNKTDGLKYATFSGDVCTVAVASDGMKVDKLATWNGRILAAGKLGAERTIFGSEYLVGTNFTISTNPASTDPFQITVAGALDESVTAIYSSFRGYPVWMKPHSFGILSGGTSRESISPQVKSDNVGTSYQESIRDADGTLIWFGPERKIYAWTGAEFSSISDDIDDFMATLVQGDVNHRSFTLTTQSDFESGTISPSGNLATADTPGTLKLSTGTLIDNFSDGEYTSSPTWTNTDPSVIRVISNQIDIGPASEEVIYTSNSQSTGSWKFNLRFVVPTPYSSPGTYFAFVLSTSAVPNLTSGTMLLSQNGYFIQLDHETSTMYIKKDAGTILLGPFVYQTPTETTNPKIIDLARSAGGRLTFSIKDTVTGSVLSTSTVDTTYSVFPTIGIIGLVNNSYHRIFVDDIFTLPNTGIYQSPPMSLGSGAGSLGTFNVSDVTYGASGSLAYAIYMDSDTSTTPSTPSTWFSSQTLTNGQYITASTAAYAVLVSTFDRISNFYSPLLYDESIIWTEGSTLRMASAYHRGRYHLGIAVSSSSNNRDLVFQSNEKWIPWRIAPDCMLMDGENLYFGNASGIWKYGGVYTDDGSEIVSYWKTKRLAPAGADTNSKFSSFRVTAKNSVATSTTTFFVDGKSTEYSLGSKLMDDQEGVQNFKLPFSANQVQQGRYIDLKLSISASSLWRIINGNLYFQRDPEPKG